MHLIGLKKTEIVDREKKSCLLCLLKQSEQNNCYLNVKQSVWCLRRETE